MELMNSFVLEAKCKFLLSGVCETKIGVQSHKKKISHMLVDSSMPQSFLIFFFFENTQHWFCFFKLEDMTIHTKQDLYNKEEKVLVFCRKIIDNTARVGFIVSFAYRYSIYIEH